MGTFSGILGVTGAIASGVDTLSKDIMKAKLEKDIRKKLDEIYNEIKHYENEKTSMEAEVESSKSKIETLNAEITKNPNVSRLELMKKQMDLMIAEETLKVKQTELEKNNSKKLESIIKSITENIYKIERNIYIAVRFNDIGYINCFKGFETSGTNPLILKEAKIEIQDPEFIFFDELKQVRDYYEKATNIITDEEKLNMFESLIDEMIAEVIKEDMKKNNIALPDFVKGMRYFKHENE